MLTFFTHSRARLNPLLCALLGFCAAIGIQSMMQGHSAQAAPNSGVTVAALLTRLNADEAIIAALKAKTAPITVKGTDLTFTGVNVHIVSGAGSTSDRTVVRPGKTPARRTLTGLGNLIIGYNGGRGNDHGDTRTGSHNLILGDQNNYSSYGGLIGGIGNTISGHYSSVSAGHSNTASGDYSSVSGGYSNTATSLATSISGGCGNKASGQANSVSGGTSNKAIGAFADSISGGANNTTIGNFCSVSGGVANTADGLDSSVSGGVGNKASGNDSSISGGENLTQTVDFGWQGGAYHTP